MKKIIYKVRFVFVLAVVVGGLLYYSHYSLKQFEAAYGQYQTLAAAQQNDAFLPGAADNPLRNQLNGVLAEVLAPQTAAKDRLVLSHQGLDLILSNNAQVDAIGKDAQDVQDASDNLEAVANRPGNILHWGRMRAIVAVAKQELYTIEDIRGLSYRANFETAEIFNRIISDNGQLTAAYTKELNSDLPQADASFNDRQNSYSDLQSQIYQIARDYSALTGS